VAQLKDIRLIDNGARFHNVDLHIHSYGASSDVKDATMAPFVAQPCGGALKLFGADSRFCSAAL
jgi:hypothetical protein